ncbi:MAG: hypothetical protein CO108_20130 [Deltaproteobacteria bacterium CG_4_9_14_3_um_filter_63_12]|nr:MAG: hypothetical protein CO108_20130 [Deltaproteobacteria bacterium CG_4_9_14_3_um_filter_63_12]
MKIIYLGDTRPARAPQALEPARLRAALGLLFTLVLFSSGCGDNVSDCYTAGTCECAGSWNCEEGFYCDETNVCVVDEGYGIARVGFGESCVSNAGCRSGSCLPEGPGNGGVCTQECRFDPCPDGWECKRHQTGGTRGAVDLCVQVIPSKICEPCAVDAHCNAIGDHCLELDGEFVCATDCSITGECPAGYVCTEVQTETATLQQCITPNESCECSDENVGVIRTCSSLNRFGTCYGDKVCEAGPPASWGVCGAPEAALETCNGEDDDCDGLFDVNDPSIDTTGLPDDLPFPSCINEFPGGRCVGEWHCEDQDGAYGWSCGSISAQDELCNGHDDNCDGIADDPFIDEQGRYVHLEHCGHCGVACADTIPHLLTDADGVVESAATCSLREEEPACIPVLCEPGFYPFPEERPVTCAPLVSPACQPCTLDEDCRISSDICVKIGDDPGTFCAQSCSPDSPYFGCTGAIGTQDCCPDGYTCGGTRGALFCEPQGDTCTCNVDRVAATRSCIITGGQGEFCQGVQTCEDLGQERYEWNACEQSDIVVEVCDHVDNNCDGVVDEGYRNPNGNYDTDEHCGECNVNCPSFWDPDIQHAIGACVPVSNDFECQFVACTEETWVAVGPCLTDSDCGAGSTCDLQIHQCTCDGDACASNCGSDADCRGRFGDGYVCSGGLCQIHLQFHNPNDLEADGCECGQVLGAGPDLPDIVEGYPRAGHIYVDADCDGVDGTVSTSLFVYSGTTQSLGTREAPYRTIAEATAAFDRNKHTAILVAAGTYYENVRVASGVGLYGGYNADFSVRDVVLYPTWIRGQEPNPLDVNHHVGTVSIAPITVRTVLAGFMIEGYDVHYDPASGLSAPASYAVAIEGAGDTLEVANNLIVAGRGGDGIAGNRGEAGANGQPGGRGNDSKECLSADCSGELRAGGAGGTNSVCSSAAGHAGADGRPPTDGGRQAFQTGGIDGRGGYDNYYEHNDDPSQDKLCKYDCVEGSGTGETNGQDAASGPNGTAGAGGAGCTSGFGSVQSGRWVSGSSTAGAAGTAGGGGGGGGAGGGVKNNNEFTGCTVNRPVGDIGGTGGGGGAGGCSARGGASGGGGGASIAVFIVPSGSMPALHSNRIRRGFGGAGGDGGGGGQGGLGAQGGAGGDIVWPAWCGGEGGRGGRGGDGGAGGGGGGGCGGPSFGVAGVGISSASYTSKNTFETPGTDQTGGPGGNGGPSPAGDSFAGTDGGDGIANDVKSF